MAFGFKLKSVKTKGAYTIEELFEKIKDIEFEAGYPNLTKHGATLVITFPALDMNNQVWIIPGQFKKQCSKWTVQKNQEAGLLNVAVNETLGDLTDGLTKMSGVVGGNAKRIEQMVESTADQLGKLGHRGGVCPAHQHRPRAWHAASPRFVLARELARPREEAPLLRQRVHALRLRHHVLHVRSVRSQENLRALSSGAEASGLLEGRRRLCTSSLYILDNISIIR